MVKLGNLTPPLSKIATDLWIAERPFKLPFLIGDIVSRMTIVRLAGGELWLHSPVRLDPELRAELACIGPVQAIVAPSKAHHLFVAECLKAYPEAKLYGAPGLPDQRKDLAFDSVLSDEAPSAWRGQLKQYLFRGAPRLNEIVFFHPLTRTVIFTDLVFNIAAEDAARARGFNWLTIAARHWGQHRLIRRMITDRLAARTSVEKILRWDFARVIVGHGNVIEGGGRERLRAAFSHL
jgi:hypothetical protein